MTRVERRPGLPLHPSALGVHFHLELHIHLDLDTLVDPAYGVR